MEILTVFVEFVNATLNLYLTYYFFTSFWEKKYSFPITVCFFAIIDLLFTCVLFFCEIAAIKSITIFVLTIVLAMLFKAKISHRIIYTAIIFGIMGATETIIAIALTRIFSLEFNGAQTGTLYITGILLSKFFTFIIIISIRIKRHTPLLQIYKKNQIVILSFPLATFSVLVLLHGILIYHPIQNSIIYISTLICCTVLIMANIIIFDFIDTLSKNKINESKVSVANEIIANQTAQYQVLVEHHKDIIKMRHDHKNFCIGLISDIENGNIKEILSKIRQEYKLCVSKAERPNDIIHTIVDIKSDLAKESGAVIDFEYHELQKLKIQAVDIAVILGNALDNAIEAVRYIPDNKSKIISLFISLKNDTVFITVKNATHEVIDTNNLSTKKTDSEYHGFGILSMKQIATKYSGEVLFKFEDHIFTTSIFLHNHLFPKNDE